MPEENKSLQPQRNSVPCINIPVEDVVMVTRVPGEGEAGTEGNGVKQGESGKKKWRNE